MGRAITPSDGHSTRGCFLEGWPSITHACYSYMKISIFTPYFLLKLKKAPDGRAIRGWW